MKITVVKSISVGLALFASLLPGYAQNKAPKKGNENLVVEKLLASMTLEEKAGQMTQIDLSKFLKPANEPFAMDQAKLDLGIGKYQVGSILNNGYDKALSQENWHKVIRSIQETAGKTRLKIPVLYGIDAIHGATYLLGGTLYAQNIGLGCTRNTELAVKLGNLTGIQTRALGIPWNFAPVLDVGRQPLWARFCETFGEDPVLASKMGSALIKGMQGNNLKNPDAVAACMKHFMGYSMPYSGKDRTPSLIPDQMLREIFLPPFTAAVKQGAKTVMINSGEVNGVPVHASHYLLTDVLRKELGFEGLVVTDWDDIHYLHTRHHIAASQKEAVLLAIQAGIDMSMTPYTFDFPEFIVQLVKEGKLSEARINQSVRRILQLKYELGLLENAMPPAFNANLVKPEHRALALEAAREAVVMLKNDKQALPLTKGKKYLVTGPAADWLPSLSGSWSYTWQGNKPDMYPTDEQSFLAAFTRDAGSANVKYVKGSDFLAPVTGGLAQAQLEAANADAIIVVLGEAAYAESPGNIDDLDLSTAQLELAKAMAATGKPVTLVLLEGRPRIIREIDALFPGIVLGMLPGPQGAQAITEILFGTVNPSGKLSFTYPMYSNNLTLYDYKYSEYFSESAAYPSNKLEPGFHPQYPFGHGLSYTTYKYDNLSLSSDSFKGKDTLLVGFTLTNTGNREGVEIVDLFVSDLYATVTPANKRLRAFTRVKLAAGASEKVSFKISKTDLDMVNAKSQRVTEDGEFEVLVGTLKKKFGYKN